MSSPCMQKLVRAMRQSGLIRYFEHLAEQFPDAHLKDLAVDRMLPDRRIEVDGHIVYNFGSDSFLGLDCDSRVIEAIRQGLDTWGTHNGASRAFCSVRSNVVAERKLADWLGTEETVIYPSVTLANLGAIPGLVGKQDILVIDEQAHNSIQEGAKIARANGTRVVSFGHCDPVALDNALRTSAPYRCAIVAIDGVYSMSGELPPLAELNRVALNHNAILYVDDAHATGVTGSQGRGTVLDSLGSYDNTLVVGSLSKGFSCAGAFIGCSAEMKMLLKMRSNTYIFGGPVVPAYLDAVCVVCDIMMSGEYQLLIARLQANLGRLRKGLERLGLVYQGGVSPIVSVLVGGEEETLRAGKWLYEQGYYVQSVAFPAVPYHAGVLRIQINANHTSASIDGLVNALSELARRIEMPRVQNTNKRAA
ncbi:MAG: pyridoxal phosphate-dependent aminotransferase family protein [Planctomycetia bacterium]|nr:pyridoxal phosphate-dependent aminotransferase family protein [Planctomycetia bacterium]